MDLIEELWEMGPETNKNEWKGGAFELEPGDKKLWDTDSSCVGGGFGADVPETHPSDTQTKWHDAHTALHASFPPSVPTMGIRSQAAHCPASPWTRRDTYGDRSGSRWANLTTRHNPTTPPHPLPTNQSTHGWLACVYTLLWPLSTLHYQFDPPSPPPTSVISIYIFYIYIFKTFFLTVNEVRFLPLCPFMILSYWPWPNQCTWI